MFKDLELSANIFLITPENAWHYLNAIKQGHIEPEYTKQWFDIVSQPIDYRTMPISELIVHIMERLRQ